MASSSIASSVLKRGAFIVFEGIDRCGKTTQCQMLMSSLKSAGVDADFMRFPDRSTSIGSILNSYLTNAVDVEDHAVHLLFAANRWEKVKTIHSLLDAGKTIICDRYAFSGCAYSSAKGIDLEWCKKADAGLPAPDLVLFLDMDIESASKRGAYGEERFEKIPFQRKIYENYQKMRDSTWTAINAQGTIEEVHSTIFANVMKAIQGPLSEKVPLLFTSEQ